MSELDTLRERVRHLEAERDSMLERWLLWRGIDPDDACPECGGAGAKTYPSTATWRGGCGGQAMTRDACDRCWGSGSASRPWPSHRLFRTA